MENDNFISLWHNINGYNYGIGEREEVSSTESPSIENELVQLKEGLSPMRTTSYLPEGCLH